MSTDMGRGMDLLTARQRAEADTQRRQRAARRAYEGGDMTLITGGARVSHGAPRKNRCQ